MKSLNEGVYENHRKQAGDVTRFSQPNPGSTLVHENLKDRKFPKRHRPANIQYIRGASRKVPNAGCKGKTQLSTDMNKPNLLIIVLSTTLISCNTQTNSEKGNHSSFNVNDEIKKRRGESVVYYRNIQLDSVVKALFKNDTIATALGKSQERYLTCSLPGHSLVMSRFMNNLDDIVIIRSGHGTLKTGYEVIEKIRTSGEEPWRNWFCDGIKNPIEQNVSPGDFIIIPAMTAHQYIPDHGDTLTYWTIKIKHLK